MSLAVFDTGLIAAADSVSATEGEFQLAFTHDDLSKLKYVEREEQFTKVAVIDVYAMFVDDPGTWYPLMFTVMPAVEVVGFITALQAVSLDAARIATANTAINELLTP